MKRTFEKPVFAKTEFEASAHLASTYCITYPPCTGDDTSSVSGGNTNNGGSGCVQKPGCGNGWGWGYGWGWGWH